MKTFDYIPEMMALALQDTPTLSIRGRVIQVTGTIIKAVVPTVKVGEVCLLRNPGEAFEMKAEVVGFQRDAALLTPIGDMVGLSAATEVTPTGRVHMVPVGPGLLGRVLDGLGRPMDAAERGLLEADKFYPVFANAPDPLKRRIISQPMELGVRALDGLLTCGEGQRLGIMAGPGIGKSVLLGMLARSADADVIVVGLVGERGREVREFVERDLGTGMARSVVVGATGDESPLERVGAGMAATAVAEFFRDQGKRVLLLIDSLSRVAMAQREIGLAAGEPPTSRGYPPSVFAALPRLVERAGNGEGQGSITAMYTVLAEGDDLTDPVVDASRACLDGHIVLSRNLAMAGHFPAVDVLGSVSRVMNDVVTPDHRTLARRVRDVLSAYKDAADLVEVGAYVSGTNARVDAALRCINELNAFLCQEPSERFALAETLTRLRKALDGKSDGKSDGKPIALAK